ncbi:MAG TPA: hypothetical protein VLB50_09745 [Ignavibacteriaceae bacterium]|nr:hypothetical protein [Ignavibacteriaceae bacterium]
MENNLETAYQNAKKGIYWALANIPEKKKSIASDLIDNEKLYASVRLEKEFEGIKITAKGFFNSVEVSITVYRSDDGLLKDGYLKKTEEESKAAED